MQTVVAEAQRDEHGGRLDPAGKDSDDIERGLVGPVNVLEHEHAGRTPAELGQERPGNLVGPRAPLDEDRELAARFRGRL